ncbi:hypothetical protein SAMN05216524_104126 [Mucilaginibacter sp. OK098]|nr:hypothetical protein SAMN05216524_104126 [Mucilaginibacter sp. OK098]
MKELELENSVDTLGRWMAHYVAEKIAAAKKAEGIDKPAAESECAKAVLDLWNHRWTMQYRHQPLKDFTRLLELLRQIDPETFDPYYFRFAAEKKKVEDNVWLVAAYDIDKAARVCLKYMLTKAAEAVSSTDTKAILEIAEVIGADPDIMVIQTLLGNKDYELDPDDLKLGDEFNADFGQESIRNNIVYLDKLINHAEEIKSKLNDELGLSSN